MPSVLEVIDKIEKVGLVVQKNPSKGSHTLWDVVDPKSGTILTGISAHADKKGGDRNWHFNIRRVLRKAGFKIEFGEERKRKSRALTNNPKKRGVIDLEALKKAQDQAAAAGHRIPLIDDLEDDRDFLKRIKISGNIECLTDDATGEVISTMTSTADSPRVYNTVERLKRFMELRGPELSKRAEKRQLETRGDLRGFRPGGGINAEFVRVAIEEVAPERGLRAWKSVDSGQQTISAILKAEKPGMSVWTVQLVEATMDHLEGMKWGVIDPDKIKAIPPKDVEDIKGKRSEDSTPPQEGPDQTTYDIAIQMIEEYEETLRQVTELGDRKDFNREDWIAVADKSGVAYDAVLNLSQSYTDVLLEKEALKHQVANVVNVPNGISDQYATVLLDLLKNFEADKQGNQMLDLIFTRLDKLAGI